MDEQQICSITSIIVIQPIITTKSLSHILPISNTGNYLLKVDASHANTILIQSQSTKASINSYDVSKIVYDPETQPFYWHNVRSFIEATLIGYHGMIIFLQSSHIQLKNTQITPLELLYESIDQIFYCINNSKCKHTQLFQVLFSHYALSIEDCHVFDLCRGLETAAYLFRDVQGRQQKLIKTTITSIDSLKQLINRNYSQFLSEISQDGSSNLAKLGYHEFMCVNVGFTGFSASFAPIGGELTFVTLSTDYFSTNTNSQTKTGTTTLDIRNQSLLTANTIDPLKSLLDHMKSKNISDSTFPIQNPLCTLLRDGVGGPCKTCVITVVPDKFVLNENEEESSNELCQILSIAHQFALVRNYPNRRIFAEKALMNIYMQELSTQTQNDVNGSELPNQNEDEQGEDYITQAAIALEKAVLEYTFRLKITKGESDESESVDNIKFIKNPTIDSQEISESTTPNNISSEEKLVGDLVPHLPTKLPQQQKMYNETVITYNPAELQKTASTIPDLEHTNPPLVNVTRITVKNSENTESNGENTQNTIKPTQIETHNDAITLSPNQDSNRDNDADMEAGYSGKILPFPARNHSDSDLLEELIYEEIINLERSKNTTISDTENTSEIQNEKTKDNIIDSNLPLQPKGVITMSQAETNENVPAIKSQPLNSATTKSEPEKIESSISNHKITLVTENSLQNKLESSIPDDNIASRSDYQARTRTDVVRFSNDTVQEEIIINTSPLPNRPQGLDNKVLENSSENIPKSLDLVPSKSTNSNSLSRNEEMPSPEQNMVIVTEQNTKKENVQFNINVTVVQVDKRYSENVGPNKQIQMDYETPNADKTDTNKNTANLPSLAVNIEGLPRSLHVHTPLFEQTVETEGDAQIAEVVTFMLQDPLRGAARCYQARGSNEVLQRRDLGSVFTGHVITTWIMENVTGIQEWHAAEEFGQWLLDQGALIHSEGSYVFAGAESLFYYARRSQPGTGNLSFDEIKRLMSEATKVLQPANTEFYEPNNSKNPNENDKDIANDDMIYHQLIAEQNIVIQNVNRNAGKNILNKSQTNGINRNQLNESLNSSFTVIDNSSSIGSGKRFLWDKSLNEGGGAVNQISEMFQTHDVTVKNLPIHPQLSESNQTEEIVKIVERKEKVLIGNLTEKYVENIIQVYELHPLFENCRSGCRMGVLKNLVLTFGVNFEDEQKRTAIFYAAASDQGRIGIELIRSHANVNHIDKSGLTPLLVAAQLGHVSFMSMLLNHGADVTLFDNAGSNAYHLACKLEATGCLMKLMKKANQQVLNKLDKCGFSPIHYAIQNGFAVHIEMLLKYEIDITILDSKGLSYISFAIFNQSMNCITPMLKRYPVLLGQPNIDLSTPLHVAAIQTTSEYLQLLLNSKAYKKHFDVHQCDSKGRTVLHAACKRGVEDSIRLLLRGDSSVFAVDDSGNSSLKYAQANERLSQDLIDLMEATEVNQMKGVIKLQEAGSKTCQIQ
ncbi:Transcription factor inhibitor ECI-6 [Oopsacas minuta]|uniref:Transcription factor inhibitor ECI-6 n=1 Tax=Oopsacas minuta TaxID=111878 RepID=A0AAV7JLJ8_9METZ|nr:Transcription factor inhibitor ECI-6 [Oopsacas minuta]